MRNKSIASNAVFNVIYKILNVAFPLITSMYASRILMSKGIGEVAYAKNIVSYFILCASLGIPHYGIKEIARRSTRPEDRNIAFSELFIINFISTAIFSCAYLLLISSSTAFNRNLHLYLAVAAPLFLNIFNVDWFYQGIESYAYITARSIIIKTVSLVLIFLLVKDTSDYILYAFISSFATIGNYIFNIIHCRKLVRITFRDLDIKRHLKPVAYLLAVSISLELYSKIDVTMLGSMFERNIVGYYNNAQKTVNVALTLIVSITAVFLPRLSYYYKSDREKFCQLVNKGFKIVLLFSIPCFLGICIIAPSAIAALYGSDFSQSVPTIRILAVLIIIKSVGDILCYQVMVSSDNEKRLLTSNVLAAVVNIALNALLIPAYKHNGAAVASVVSELILNTTLLVKARRITDFSVDFRFVFKVMLGSAVMGIALVYIQSLDYSELILMLLSLTVGVSLFFLSQLILKNELCMELLHMIGKLRRRENDLQT